MKCVFYNNVNLLEQWIKLFVIYVILIDFILIFQLWFSTASQIKPWSCIFTIGRKLNMPISYDLVLKFSTVFISLTENRQYLLI